MADLRAGTITLKVNGGVLDAKGSFTYNLGIPLKKMIPGADRVHGAFSTVQVPFIEGVVTDDEDLDLAALQGVMNATVTLDLANGKTILLSGACYAGEGNVTTEQGEIAVRWEGKTAVEI
jgi:hypothetical protein